MQTIMRVSTRGRVVIPIKLRRRYKIKPGSRVEFSEGEFGSIVLTTQKRRRVGQAAAENRDTKKHP
jgi:AbrB family looped-hinge helix DNA binding protein